MARSTLHSHELARVVPRQTAMVLIDKLIVPSELDGSQGRFRAPGGQCMMRAPSRGTHQPLNMVFVTTFF